MSLQTQDSDSETDLETTGRHQRPLTFRERHGLKILGVFLGGMFALVVAVQVAC